MEKIKEFFTSIFELGFIILATILVSCIGGLLAFKIVSILVRTISVC